MSRTLRDSSGRDDREVRVLRRRGDERDPAVLDGREQRVLLGLGEPVDLVDEEHRLAAATSQAAPGVVDHLTHVLDPGRHGRELDEGAGQWPGRPGRRAWSCRCPAAPRAARDTGDVPPPAAAPSTSRRRGAPGASRWSCPTTSSTRARPHPHGQRRVGRRPLVAGGREEVCCHQVEGALETGAASMPASLRCSA